MSQPKKKQTAENMIRIHHCNNSNIFGPDHYLQLTAKRDVSINRQEWTANSRRRGNNSDKEEGASCKDPTILIEEEMLTEPESVQCLLRNCTRKQTLRMH